MSGRGGGRGGRFESNPNKTKNPTPHTNNNNNTNTNNNNNSKKNHSRSHGNNRGEMSQQGCFKCGEIGHLSRECTKVVKNNNPANNYRRNLNLNIDGTLKNDVGKILKEFQDNPTLTEYAFPPDLTNTERRFIHTFCKNFGLTSKSTGGPKGSPNRYVVIYKGKEKKEEKAARKHPLPKLAFNRMESTSLIDGFLQYYQTPPNVAASSSSSSSASSSSHSPQETVDLQKLASDYARELAAAPSNPARQQLSATLQHLHDDRTKQRASAPSVSSLQQFRRNLPIAAQREDILRMIDANQVIVLSSSTGSGKSTQVPQYILEHLDGLGRGGETDIIVTQPRRISAMSLAQRVAQEREVEDDGLGGTVGYQIRLEACRSNKTRLLYCTIGVLLRRLSSDRLLRGISHIIVDEVHERDRLADFLLIILKDILPIRPDLKLILMSATLNADMFSTYFNNCPHIHIEGFTYPVHTFYLEDVIELTGYQPPALNSRSMDASQRRQVEAAKEKKLRDLLNLSLNQVLTIESKVPTKHGGMIVNPSKASLDDDDDAGKDDEAALAALANIASMGASESFNGAASASSPSSSTVASSSIDSLLEPTNLVTGWTDTFVYKPEVDNPFDNSTTASTISLDSIIAGVDAEFASKSNITMTAAAATTSVTVAAPEAVSASLPSNKKLHPSQISSAALTSSLTMLSKSSSPPASSSGGSLQNPLSGLNYSRATLDVIQRIEDEGMDYIDYDLILNVILFICQKFDDSLLGGGAKSSSVDDDPINIYNGSILVFLPGWEDICKLLDMVAAHPVLRVAHKYLCLPLHGSISSQQQRQIFVRPEKGQRKIIFSTNIAETSITIDDVVFVLDSGKMKEKTYDAMTKMCALSSTWISQANAKQRSGRAGRCRRGVCFRLYTQKKYDTMEVFQTPELLRTPLEELCLQVKLLRLGKVDTFLSKALQPPTRPSILDALDLLTRLGALTSNEDLTLLGEYLAAMPLDPRLAKMILYGAIFKCLDPILTIAASLSYRDPFILPVQWEREKAQLARQKLANGSQSDMLCLLHAYHGYMDQQRTNGIRGASAFCREYFLSLTTMQMIEKLKVQYMDTLKETGWLDHLVPSGANSVASVKSSRSHDHSSHSRGALRQLTGSSLELNAHQHNLSVLTAIICLGMYPMCAKVQPQNPHKKRRAILCTRNNLQNICLHPASVSSKDFRRAATHADAWTIDARLNINPPSEAPSYVQYCVFFESMRSSEVFLRNVHWVQPLCLALFGTGDRTLMVRGSPPPLAKKEKKTKSEKKARREREYEDDEDEDGEDVDELIDNIFAENDDDDDDDYDDDDESDLDDDSGNIFHVDEWIRFGVHPSDGQRILQLRSFLSFIVDSFMRRSGVHSTSPSTPSLTPAMIQVADQAVEFFVKLLTYELAPPNAQIKAHANVQMQPPVAAQQHQPQQGHSLRSQQQAQPQTHRNGPQPTPQHHQQQRSASAQVRHQSKQPQSHPPHQSHPSVHHSGPLTVAELEAKLARLQVEAAQESVQSSTSQQARTLYQPPSLDSSHHPSHHRRNNHADENDSHPRGDSRRGGGSVRGRGNRGRGGGQQRHA